MHIIQRLSIDYNGKNYFFGEKTFIEGIYPSKKRAYDAFYKKTIQFLEHANTLNILYNFNGKSIQYLFDLNFCKKYLDYDKYKDEYDFIYKNFINKFRLLSEKSKKDFINKMKYSFYIIEETKVYNEI